MWFHAYHIFCFLKSFAQRMHSGQVLEPTLVSELKSLIASPCFVPYSLMLPPAGQPRTIRPQSSRSFHPICPFRFRLDSHCSLFWEEFLNKSVVLLYSERVSPLLHQPSLWFVKMFSSPEIIKSFQRYYLQDQYGNGTKIIHRFRLLDLISCLYLWFTEYLISTLFWPQASESHH